MAMQRSLPGQVTIVITIPLRLSENIVVKCLLFTSLIAASNTLCIFIYSFSHFIVLKWLFERRMNAS